MVFAISPSPSKRESKKEEEEKEEVKQALTATIKLHSGNVVENGFHEMFFPPMDVDGDLVLHSEWYTTTFCAVIADGYTRKPKYVQALALGVPCLSSRWIENCIKQVPPPITPNSSPA